jgi:hypothetical protein
MLDDVTNGASAPLPRCMWCSAVLPSDSEVTCPTCGATLIGETDGSVPGVTAIDAEAIVRGSKAIRAKPRSRLMSWISGDYDEGGDSKPAPPGSLAPPPLAVRREILRLELEAEVANLQAEAGAIAAEAAVESGIPLDTLNADLSEAIAAATHPDAAPAPAADAAPDVTDPATADAATEDAAPATADAATEDAATEDERTA